MTAKDDQRLFTEKKVVFCDRTLQRITMRGRSDLVNISLVLCLSPFEPNVIMDYALCAKVWRRLNFEKSSISLWLSLAFTPVRWQSFYHYTSYLAAEEINKKKKENIKTLNNHRPSWKCRIEYSKLMKAWKWGDPEGSKLIYEVDMIERSRLPLSPSTLWEEEYFLETVQKIIVSARRHHRTLSESYPLW